MNLETTQFDIIRSHATIKKKF